VIIAAIVDIIYSGALFGQFAHRSKLIALIAHSKEAGSWEAGKPGSWKR